MNRNFRKLLLAALPVIAVAQMIPLAALADIPGRHPGYLRAISDLRYARGLLARPDRMNVVTDESNAIREIDACLNDLVRASINDGKNLWACPPIDSGWTFGDRLHRSLDVLRKARSDMDREEDDPANLGLQSRANVHVDRAISFVKRAIGDKRWDEGR